MEGSALDVWTRALPLLVIAYPLLALYALQLGEWSTEENLGAAVVVVAIAVATWALSNRLRGHPTFGRPTDIDTPELVLFVLGPALPALLFGQVTDAASSVATSILILALIYIWTAYGIGPLLRWASRQAMAQIGALIPLVVRGLPLLLVFNAFLFINAEVWEVTGALRGLPYWIVIATFVTLATLFAATRVPRLIRSLNRFESWDDVVTAAAETPARQLDAFAIAERSAANGDGPLFDPLTRRQRFNIGLVVLFSQGLQVTLIVAALFGFFLAFGFVAIGEPTARSWTGLDDFEVFATVTIDGRQLVLTEPLLRVSLFLGVFSGMYFTVLLSTDATYREEFDAETAPQIRSALAARCIYRVARSSHREGRQP